VVCLEPHGDSEPLAATGMSETQTRAYRKDLNFLPERYIRFTAVAIIISCAAAEPEASRIFFRDTC
jgi:hypothetical protein